MVRFADLPAYDVIYKNDREGWGAHHTVLSGPHLSLEDAKNARKVNGDLVVFHGTTDVVPSEDWLWEDRSIETYALREIEKARKRTRAAGTRLT